MRAHSLRPPDPLPTIDMHEHLGSGGIDLTLEDALMRWQPISHAYDVIVVDGLKPDLAQGWASLLDEAMATALDAEGVLVATLGAACDREVLGDLFEGPVQSRDVLAFAGGCCNWLAGGYMTREARRV